MPVAPTVTLDYLMQFADRQQNPVVDVVGGTTAILVTAEQPYLQTASGLKVALWTEFPAYGILRQCRLCLTTVGANTAELGALGIPMIVLLPIYQLDAVRTWDGIPGILARLPVIGSPISKLITGMAIRAQQRNNTKFAWPNIWAGREIVPELVGKLTVSEVAGLAIDLLDHPEKLAQIQADLAETRGETGAANKIAKIVGEMLEGMG
jgi:lipid-A-disaccharide synthase